MTVQKAYTSLLYGEAGVEKYFHQDTQALPL